MLEGAVMRRRSGASATDFSPVTLRISEALRMSSVPPEAFDLAHRLSPALSDVHVDALQRDRGRPRSNALLLQLPPVRLAIAPRAVIDLEIGGGRAFAEHVARHVPED